MTRIHVVVTTASLVLAVAACGGGRDGDIAVTTTTTSGPSVTVAVPSSEATTGRILGPGDSGAIVPMRVGDTARIVVPDPFAPDLAVEGPAVQLVRVNNAVASGQREWEVRAAAVGRAVVRGTGTAPFVLTFDVSP